MYAKIINQVVEKYPYSIGNLRKDNPQTSFPKNPSDELLASWNVLPVADVAQPAHDPVTQTVDELQPVFANGRWERSWAVRAKTAQELAGAQQALQDGIVTATQQRLDDFARTRNYDGILSACTYATSTVPKFQAEGQYAVTARDATWAKLYEMLAEVEAGTRPMPTSFADIEPELPVLTWPV